MSLTVCQILPALEAGGVERGTVEVAAALVAAGHRAVVISAGGRLVAELDAAGARHVELPVGRKSLLSLRYVRTLRTLWREHDVDVVHVRSRAPAWLAYLAWRGLPAERRPRFITSIHGPYTPNAYSAIMLKGEVVIVISEFIADYVRRAFPRADHTRMVVIPRGVSRDRYPHGFRPASAWRESFYAAHPALRDRSLLTLPARLTRWKGQREFIAMLAQLGDPPDYHALLVGGEDGSGSAYRDELLREIAAAGLRERVTLLGHRDDLREILSLSAIAYSLTTAPEAFGRTTIEALSLGTPVIGYAHGGTREILARVLPEGLVAPRDIAAAAARTREFLARPPPVPAEHPYRLEQMLDQTLAVYADA